MRFLKGKWKDKDGKIIKGPATKNYFIPIDELLWLKKCKQASLYNFYISRVHSRYCEQAAFIKSLPVMSFSIRFWFIIKTKQLKPFVSGEVFQFNLKTSTT